MKTPDEIKRGLMYCSDGYDPDCEHCTYATDELCVEHVCCDALAYINQLENQLRSAGPDSWKRRAEAAERDLVRFNACDTCKHGVEDDWDPCEICIGLDTGEPGLRRNHYEWRGPCKENGGVE